MPKLITVTDMTRSFSDIIARVYYQGETFEIKKGANIVARLSPVSNRSTIAISDLNNFFSNRAILEQDDNQFSKDIAELKSMQNQNGGNKWD